MHLIINRELHNKLTVADVKEENIPLTNHLQMFSMTGC